MNQKTILALFAVSEEKFDIKIPGYKVVHVEIGIAKASAAMNTMKAIMTYKPDYVMLIGSSGSKTLSIGDIVVSTHFIDRNFESTHFPGLVCDVRALEGFPIHLPSFVKGTLCEDYIVNTGDDFVTDDKPFTGHVCDMETFAVNMVCLAEHLPFVAVRYVTDIIGQNSVKLWQEKLSEMREAMKTYFDEVVVGGNKAQ